MRQLMVLRNSELESWRLCHARHGYQWIDGLQPRELVRALTFGTLHHVGVAAGWLAAWREPDWSNAQRKAEAVAAAALALGKRTGEFLLELERMPQTEDTERMREETLEASNTALWTVQHYFDRSEHLLHWVPLGVELSFQVPVLNRVGKPDILIHEGTMDLVLWDRDTGRIVVDDHKTTSNDPELLNKKLELETQLTGYVNAVERLHKSCRLVTGATDAARAVVAAGASDWNTATIGSVAFNVARSRKPSHPTLNLLTKKQVQTSNQSELYARQESGEERTPMGEVSVKQIDTLPEIYRAALEDQLIDRELPITDKQRELLASLERKGDTYYRRFEGYKNPDERERWRSEMWTDSKRIRDARKDRLLRTRNPLACTGPASPRCQYALICSSPDDPIARGAYRVEAEETERANAEQAAQQEEFF